MKPWEHSGRRRHPIPRSYTSIDSMNETQYAPSHENVRQIVLLSALFVLTFRIGSLLIRTCYIVTPIKFPHAWKTRQNYSCTYLLHPISNCRFPPRLNSSLTLRWLSPPLPGMMQLSNFFSKSMSILTHVHKSPLLFRNCLPDNPGN